MQNSSLAQTGFEISVPETSGIIRAPGEQPGNCQRSGGIGWIMREWRIRCPTSSRLRRAADRDHWCDDQPGDGRWRAGAVAAPWVSADACDVAQGGAPLGAGFHRCRPRPARLWRQLKAAGRREFCQLFETRVARVDLIDDSGLPPMDGGGGSFSGEGNAAAALSDGLAGHWSRSIHTRRFRPILPAASRTSVRALGRGGFVAARHLFIDPITQFTLRNV